MGVILAVDAPSTYIDTVAVAGTTFSFPGVPVNVATTGRVTGFTNVPANCTPTTAPAAGVNAYSGLTDGGSVAIAAINFTCSIAYPAVYSYQTGGALADTIQLTVGFNMGASDLNPANNGALQDRLTGMTYRLTYNNTALEAVEATGGSGFSTFSPNVAFAPNVVSIIGATSGSGGAANQGTNVILTRIKFVRRAGFVGTLFIFLARLFDGLSGVSVIRLSDGRGFLALQPGKGYADLELAVVDMIDAVNVSPERRKALVEIRKQLREWRQSGLLFEARSILVVEREEVGEKARTLSGLASA